LVRTASQFDAQWYLDTYPDVAQIRMDPAEHYLKYGALLRRDPGPGFSTLFYTATHGDVEKGRHNALVHLLRHLRETGREPEPRPESVLVAAYGVSLDGNHDMAIELARRHLPEGSRQGLHILQANAAMVRNDEALWLEHLNAYLATFALKPIRLKGEGALLDRFTTDAMKPVTEGPLVSIIMPAWNAEQTIEAAVRSVLHQTWQNLELLIVDDASTDGTWAKLEALAATDSRIRILRNSVNVGPYVSKNRALSVARGDYVTGHDADDWAHPQRLEKHISVVLKSQGAIRASLTYMVRMQPEGFFDTFSKQSEFAPDGVTRIASISCLFERRLLTEELGFWDSVRFGADSEMISRTQKVVGDGFRRLKQVGMVCLSTETGLTNHPEFGIRSQGGGLSPIRANYKKSWSEWHASDAADLYVAFPQRRRLFEADPAMTVPFQSVMTLSE